MTDAESTAERDEDLQNSAILYMYQNASAIEDGCGHAVPWEEMISRVRGSRKMECPVCQAPVGMVCDMVTSTTTSSDQTICFKYGKIVFQLSTKVTGYSAASKSSGILSGASGVFGSSKNITSAGGTLLAQDRIAQALDLDPKRLKILHKGKVLYPSSASAAQQSISDEIRNISQQGLAGGKDNSKKQHRKVSLVVMGSRKEEGNSGGSSLWTSLGSFATSIIKLPYAIVSISIQTAWLFVGSILDPFLLERLRLTRGRDDRHEHED